MRRSPRARRLAFRLTPYDTPRVAPRNNSEFHVDRNHAAGGVCEQTRTALRKYIYRSVNQIEIGTEIWLIRSSVKAYWCNIY